MRSAQERRGATLYVAVMGVGMIVGVIALTTSLTGRMTLRNNKQIHHLRRAAMNARTGVEYALNHLNRDSAWRSTLTSGIDTGLISTGGNGGFRFRVTDSDGDLNDDPRDHAVLRVVGVSNSQTVMHVVEVDIEPAGRALTCLESAAYAATDFEIGDGSRVNGTGFVAAGNDIVADNSNVDLDAEATGVPVGNTFNAEANGGVAAREMPGEHVFAWYVEHGTEIDISELQGVTFSTDQRIDNKRIGREFTDFGDLNPHGVYWIDCGGTNVRVRTSRILGTLVLLNAGPGTRVEDVTVLQAEARNYPVLMVEGDLRIDLRSSFSGQILNESVTVFGNQIGTNLNPTGLPYEGVTDDDLDDDYPARLDGIVYVTGTARVSDEVDIQGNLIANRITIDDDQTLKVDYTPYAFNYPPPGFSAGQGVRVLPGSYRQVSLSGN